MEESANCQDSPDAPDKTHLHCPHCRFEFKTDDLNNTLKNGFFKCPICGKKFPSPATNNPSSPRQPNFLRRHIAPLLAILGIIVFCTAIYLMKSTDRSTPVASTAGAPPSAFPSPEQVAKPPVSSAIPNAPAAHSAVPDKNISQVVQPSPHPDKMQIIKTIAAKYHASHTYTLTGGFVCLDMAIDVWNQLRTYGIDAKIMGGIITQNITAWNFQMLALEGNHAWVVAAPSPTEKVAIETTEGKVITPDMENASVYFKGIAFNTPAEIKKFEFYRRKTYETCLEAEQLVKDWNENIAGKRTRYEEIIARKSQLGIRAQECEANFNQLKEFESRAIFY